MRSVLLYHHLGLGDHIMCHGIVREYCKKYGRVTILSAPHNYPSVAFMFRDLKNLAIVQRTHLTAPGYVAEHAQEYAEVRTVGYELLNRTSGVSIEKQFYALAGVDIEKKWDNFYVERDPKREQDFYEKFAPPSDYIFLHEDPSRDFLINRNKTPRALGVFEARGQSDNIFDYLTLIERAKEIHVVDSSFMFLIEFLQYDAPGQKLYIHRYARPNTPWHLPILRKPWTIQGRSMPSTSRRVLTLLKRAARTLRIL